MSSFECSVSSLDINADEQHLSTDLNNVAIGIKYPSVMTDLLNKQELPPELTDEEAKLLDPKFLYDNNSYHQIKNPRNFSESNMNRVWKHHAYPLVLIRKAYFKLRKEEPDILQLLRDSLSRHTLFHLVCSLRIIKDYTVCLAQIRESVSQKIPLKVAGDDLSKQSRGGSKLRKRRRHLFTVPETSEGSENLSKNVYHIFLMLKEILSTLHQSEVYEGHKSFDVTEIMGVVMVGIKQLKREFKHEYSAQNKLIREGIVCNEENKKLKKKLYLELSHNYLCLCSVKTVFPDLIESIGSFMDLLDTSDI